MERKKVVTSVVFISVFFDLSFRKPDKYHLEGFETKTGRNVDDRRIRVGRVVWIW